MREELMNKIENLKVKEITVDALNIPHGDMPGDKVAIEQSHIDKAVTIFPELVKEIKKLDSDKIVITVCGGSGVGKSEIASLLTYYFTTAGVGCYTLSGDNYPHRIPQYNDAERLHIFRESAIKGMVADGEFTSDRYDIIKKLQEEGMDAAKANVDAYPWYESYIRNGREGLSSYLGTNNEIGFEEIEKIALKFKEGASKIWLRRMGRTETELWYDEVDFSNINVLIIEWTHGNSKNYKGVDIPVLLNSTPEETLEHRRMRNRDGAIDSPFTTMVLELEQKLLVRDAHKAKIIISKKGEVLSQEQFNELMK